MRQIARVCRIALHYCPIAAVTLPSATGGNGTLTYSLVPERPGLTFEETALTLSGTPTALGAYDMTLHADGRLSRTAHGWRLASPA